MVLWPLQLDTNVRPLPTFKFTNTWRKMMSFRHTYIQRVDACGCSVVKRVFPHAWGVTTTGGTGAAVAVLQPRAVGEGVSLVRRAGRRQALLESAQRCVTSRDACAWLSAGARWMCSPCPCHSPLWSLSRSPPPHWLSCCHWRRSGRGLDPRGWRGPCSRDKNYTLG